MCFQIKYLQANRNCINPATYTQTLCRLQHTLYIESKIMAGHFNSVLTAFVLIVHYRLNNDQGIIFIKWDENVLSAFHVNLDCHLQKSLVLNSDRRIMNDTDACDVVCIVNIVSCVEVTCIHGEVKRQFTLDGNSSISSLLSDISKSVNTTEGNIRLRHNKIVVTDCNDLLYKYTEFPFHVGEFSTSLAYIYF